jgi:hypothetical protein
MQFKLCTYDMCITLTYTFYFFKTSNTIVLRKHISTLSSFQSSLDTFETNFEQKCSFPLMTQMIKKNSQTIDASCNTLEYKRHINHYCHSVCVITLNYTNIKKSEICIICTMTPRTVACKIKLLL